MAAQIVNLLWIYILFSVLLWGMKFVFSGNVNHEVSITDLYMISLKNSENVFLIVKLAQKKNVIFAHEKQGKSGLQ